MTMGRRRHLCWRDGHVLVQGDGYCCLVCDRIVKTDDKVSVTVTAPPRRPGELQDPLDVASIQEWGGVG